MSTVYFKNQNKSIFMLQRTKYIQKIVEHLKQHEIIIFVLKYFGIMYTTYIIVLLWLGRRLAFHGKEGVYS